jgi:hypothetical protein
MTTLFAEPQTQNVSTRVRLVEQYQRVTHDSGRFERNERVRFLNHLLESIREHHDLATLGMSGHPVEPWQLEFLRARAARAGVDTSVMFGFILDEMPSRVGVTELRADLAGAGGRLGVNLSKRLASPLAARCARLAMVRVLGSEIPETEMRLAGAQFESEEHARADIHSPEGAGPDWVRGLRIAIAVDNPVGVALHAIGVEVKLQIQTQSSRLLVRSGMSSFGVIPLLEPGRRGWVAFRGVDFGRELMAEVGADDQIKAIRLLVARK